MGKLADIGHKLNRQGAAWERILYYRYPITDPKWQAQDTDQPVYLGELEPSHRINLYRFLLRRATQIEQAVSFSWLCGPTAPMGDHATDALEDITDEMGMHPEAWLASTPFMMALATLILGDGNREILELLEYRTTR